MITVKKTNSKDIDFIKLVKELDADLAIRDGDDHDFYHQFNHIIHLKDVIVLYDNNLPIACGAIKKFDSESMEIKRMYTIPNERSKGMASKIISELESWARELGFKKCILETGINQPEAIALYKKKGFNIIENYGQYAGIKTSFCFEKIL